MSGTPLRATTGIIDRIEPTGEVFLHEVSTRKLGYLSNNTPVRGDVRLRPGLKLTLEVEDRGNMMVVASARAAH